MLSYIFPRWNRSDLVTWCVSASVLLLSYFLFPDGDIFSVLGSLVGITALIYIAKGAVFGQVLSLLFCLFYGIKALSFHYYGETLTYLGMSFPAALFNLISWIRHPYRDSKRVKVAHLSAFRIFLTAVLCCAVTVLFYYLLRALSTADLAVSTFSVATSFFAASLSFQRSPWYAVAYMVNDIVLIVLWARAWLADPSVLPVLMCFAVFLLNDIRGFFSWRRMLRQQEEEIPARCESV